MGEILNQVNRLPTKMLDPSMAPATCLELYWVALERLEGSRGSFITGPKLPILLLSGSYQEERLPHGCSVNPWPSTLVGRNTKVSAKGSDY